MMKLAEGLPDDVVGVVATGRITKPDYEGVLIPAVEAAFKRCKKISFYYEIGADFVGFDAGAMIDDALIGMRHLIQWKRVAVVTDVDWIAHAAKAFAFLMPGRIKVYALADSAAARAWLAADEE